MLRISETYSDKSRAELKLEGRIVGDCTEYLKQHCMHYLQQYDIGELVLDFSGVSYVEPCGVLMLQTLNSEKIRIKNCPIFIDELLKNYS